MKTDITFDIESLLHGMENPTGAIEQVLFAQRIAEHEGMRLCNRLARLTFADPAINKALTGAVPLDETLLVGHEGWNEAEWHLCIRSGKSALKIAAAYFPSGEIFIHDEYRHAIIYRKLTDREIRMVFTHVWRQLARIQRSR